METNGSKVLKARTAAGLSRDALARATGLTSRTIFRIERDESYSNGSLALIAHALGLPIDSFLHENDCATGPSGRVEIGDGPTPAKKRAAAMSRGA